MPAIKLPDQRETKKASIAMIGEWKQQMMEKIAMDDQIAKLLWYDTSDALSRPDLTDDQKAELCDPTSDHRRIYPTRYTNTVAMEQHSFIGLGISGFVPQESYRQFSSKYTMGYLYFFILCDNKIMDIDEGQRHDFLLKRIYELFQDTTGFGMGTLQEGNLMEDWEQNNKFGGYVLMMKVIDMK